MSPLRLDSFKNSEVLRGSSEKAKGDPHPSFARVSADADSQEVSASAAPLDDRGSAELDARASRLSRTLERIMGRVS